MFTVRKDYMNKNYNRPGKRAIVAGLMAVTLIANGSGFVKYAYATDSPDVQIKKTDADLSQVQLQRLNLNMNDYEIVHKDATTQINTFDSSALYKKPGNSWAPTQIVQFSSKIDKNQDHVVIDNPLEVLFKNTGEYFGKQTNVRMKVNRVYYDAVDYTGTNSESKFSKSARLAAPEDEVIFSTLDNSANESGLAQFTNYNIYTRDHPDDVVGVNGSQQKALTGYYTMRADVTYTIEYADGTQADMKFVMPVSDIDVPGWVNKQLHTNKEQSEAFSLPDANKQASKIIFNNKSNTVVTQPSASDSSLSIKASPDSEGGNSKDWMYNSTGAMVRSRSNVLTFTASTADASGTDYGVYVEHPATEPTKKVDKKRITAYEDGKLVYTVQAAVPKVGVDVIDAIDKFSIEDILDNRLKNVNVKSVYTTDSEDANPADSEWKLLKQSQYTVNNDGQKLTVDIKKEQLNHKQFKVVFEVDTLAKDLTENSNIIENQAATHTDDVPSKTNTVRTQPTLMFDHEFRAKDGSQLPKSITDLTPGSKDDIDPGTTVTPLDFIVPNEIKPDKTFTGYDASKPQVKDVDKDGVWSFIGWDNNSLTLTKNGHFIGLWEFISNKYKVTYKFKSGVPNKELPQEVLDLLPNDPEKYPNGSVVKSIRPSKTEVKTSDGTWKFKEFPESLTIDHADGEFVGEWVLEKDPEPEPKPKPEPKKETPANKPVPKTGEEVVSAVPIVSGFAAIMASILSFFGIKRKSDN